MFDKILRTIVDDDGEVAYNGDNEDDDDEYEDDDEADAHNTVDCWVDYDDDFGEYGEDD